MRPGRPLRIASSTHGRCASASQLRAIWTLDYSTRDNRGLGVQVAQAVEVHEGQAV